MKVTLLNYTQDAIDLLLFTKSTRLGLTPGLMDKIKAMDEEDKMKQLVYMANTVPSSWEFVDYTFLIEGVSRAFTHQLVRTRTGSYAQQAMRVVDMSDFDYVYTQHNLENDFERTVIDVLLGRIHEVYHGLLQNDVPIEDARGILPTNIATNIIAKFNLRAFAQLIASRIGGRTQGEYRSVAMAMADAVLEVHPWAEMFIFKKDRDYYDEAEKFAATLSPKDKDQLLKIIHHMRGAGS